jgi:hypothetical protein
LEKFHRKVVILVRFVGNFINFGISLPLAVTSPNFFFLIFGWFHQCLLRPMGIRYQYLGPQVVLSVSWRRGGEAFCVCAEESQGLNQ